MAHCPIRCHDSIKHLNNHSHQVLQHCLSQSVNMSADILCPAAGHDSTQQAKQLLSRPDVRHHLSKLLYADEWAESIQESHPESEAREVTLAKHWEDVAKLKAVLENVQNKLLPLMQNRQLYNDVMGNAHGSWF